MTTPNLPEAEAFRAAQAKEYGQYVATEQIFYAGALAFNVGDPVPASNVTLHGYADLGVVAKTTTKAAAAAVAAATEGA